MACHLTYVERQLRCRLKKAGKSNTEIARLMGRHRSTVCREMRRNTGRRGYRPKQAQRLASARRVASRPPHKLDNLEVHRYVKQKLEQFWSPEQIAGRAKHDFRRKPECQLSHQTIYSWIQGHRPDWKLCLRRKGKPPEKRGQLTDCVRIDGRPEVINGRFRYGDWEGDTIVGHGRHSALVTLVERKSGYTCLARVDSMKSSVTMRATKRCFQNLPPCLQRSVTFDNGKEFAEHPTLTRGLGMEVYFAEPYASWQRGTNENTNGLVRQFFPKGTDFTQVSHHAVARVKQLLNERPRKRLNYRTPAEVLSKKLCRN
jgi:transposase, IS30 family